MFLTAALRHNRTYSYEDGGELWNILGYHRNVWGRFCLLRKVFFFIFLSQRRPNCRNSLVSLEPASTTRRKIFSPSSLQLNLNCVREERREPLLRPLGESEDSFIQMISARTPLIEADSDRESCVWAGSELQQTMELQLTSLIQIIQTVLTWDGQLFRVERLSTLVTQLVEQQVSAVIVFIVGLFEN